MFALQKLLHVYSNFEVILKTVHTCEFGIYFIQCSKFKISYNNLKCCKRINLDAAYVAQVGLDIFSLQLKIQLAHPQGACTVKFVYLC